MQSARASFYQRSSYWRKVIVMEETVEIFICSARTCEDEALQLQFEKHLHLLMQQEHIKLWSHLNLLAGDKPEQQISAHLNTANIILLLISADFFASTDCQREMKRALERQKAQEARVIPVLLRPVDWYHSPISDLQPVPKNGIPITDDKWQRLDKAFVEVVQELSIIIQEIMKEDRQDLEPAMSPVIRPTASQYSGEVGSSSFRLSDPKRGIPLLIYDKHTDAVNSISWSPDGERIASAGYDGVVRLWKPQTGQNILTYHEHLVVPRIQLQHIVFKALWSPDGQYIASCGVGSVIHIWNASTGENICFYPDRRATTFLCDTSALAWSPNGPYIASASSPQSIDQTIHIWNALTGRTLLRYSGHASKNILDLSLIASLVWSPNGHYIASYGSDRNKSKLAGSGNKNSIQIWNPVTNQCIATCITENPGMNPITCSPDSKYLAATGSNKTVNIWDTGTGTVLFSYKGHAQEPKVVAWSPDGSIIASAGRDHQVHLWRPFTGELLFVYRGHKHTVTVLAWSPDGKRIASAGLDKTVQIWQAV